MGVYLSPTSFIVFKAKVYTEPPFIADLITFRSVINMIHLLLIVVLGCLTRVDSFSSLSQTPGSIAAETLVQPPQQFRSVDDLAAALHLKSDQTLQIESSVKLSKGLIQNKLRIYNNGVPIRNFILQAISFKNGTFNGAVSGWLPPPVGYINSTISKSEDELATITANIANNYSSGRSDVEIACAADLTNHTCIKQIDINTTTGKAALVYFVRATLSTNQLIRFPRGIVDAVTGNVITSSAAISRRKDHNYGGKSCDIIGDIVNIVSKETTCCPELKGGNLKCPGPNYGPKKKQICLNATYKDGYVILANKNVEVYTLDNQVDLRQGKIVKFKPEDGPDDEINGANSPAADVWYYANQIFDFMIELNITFPDTPVRAYVHFADKFENSFSDGTNMVFGDGDTFLYPLSAADVVAHEFAHIFVNATRVSNFRDESIGSLESYCDIFAKSFSAYLNPDGKVSDWTLGTCVTKQDNTTLRTFDDPTRGGFFKDNLTDLGNSFFYKGLGIFDRAFYCIVQEENVPINDAFKAFTNAVLLFWSESTGFLDNACGVYRAASNLQLNATSFFNCFRNVGIDLHFCSLVRTQ